MLYEQIEILREQLNKMLEKDNSYGEELLRLSQELDILIIQFIKEEQKQHY